MPKIVNFNNRQIIEPGAYAKIESGIPIPPVLGTYGNVVIIDTGIGKGFGWGSGISGELESGAEAIYEFSNSDDMKKALKGGILYDLSDYLWTPSKNSSGPNKVIYARAATTESAVLELNFATVETILTLRAKSEGTVGNGITSEINGIDTVISGYAAKLKAGITNPDALILEFFEGQYRGADESGNDYDAPKSTLSNVIVARSTEFTTLSELREWMYNDYHFNQYFTYEFSSEQEFLTLLDSTETFSDITANLLEFEGGTCVYSAAAMDAILENIEDLDNSFFLCLDYGVVTTAPNSGEIQAGANKGALSVFNNKILTYIKDNSTYTEKIMFVAGGSNENEYTRPSNGNNGSLEIAKFYNDALVSVVHSGIKIPGNFSNSGGVAFRYLSSLYHTAMVCGRQAGLEPQVPVTYKDLRIVGLQHQLKKSQREQALLCGVLHSRYQPQLGWIVNQGVNSLQNNSNLITQDGKSPEIQIMRIIHQLNKELVMNATTRFVGGNLLTSSAEEVKLFVEGYLTTRTARKLQDNLIISFSKVTVKLVQDYWEVKYCFVPNGPINRVFMTGTILDSKIEI